MNAASPHVGAVRFALPVVTMLTSAGIAAIISRQLYGYPGMFLNGLASPTGAWLGPVVALTLATVTAAVAARDPRWAHAGGWPVAGAGLVVGAAVVLAYREAAAIPAMAGLIVIAAGFGVALGGVLVAAAHAPTAEQVGIAAGLTLGMVTDRLLLQGLTTGHLPFYVVAGLTVVTAALTFRRRAQGLATSWLATVSPVILVIGVAGLIRVGHEMRHMVVEEFRLSPDGLASPRRISTVAAFDEYSAIGLAVVAGLLFLWFAYRRGKADLARWVVTGFALGGPTTAVLYGFHYGRAPEPLTIAVVAALGVAAGVALTRYADRIFAWEVIGVAAAAAGMILGSAAYRIGPQASTVAGCLVAGGFAFALSSGLLRATRTATGPVGHRAVALSLGVVTMFLTANAMAPATWMALGSSGLEGFKLSVPITSLVAAVIIVLLFGFGRAVDRIRREIREQATTSQQ